MNVRFLPTLALAALAASANASEPAPLHWDCTRVGTPSLRETAATFGYDNYDKVVTARDALYRQLHVICTRGAREVVIVVPNERDDPVPASASPAADATLQIDIAKGGSS